MNSFKIEVSRYTPFPAGVHVSRVFEIGGEYKFTCGSRELTWRTRRLVLWFWSANPWKVAAWAARPVRFVRTAGAAP